jgi:hypothetical protein
LQNAFNKAECKNEALNFDQLAPVRVDLNGSDTAKQEAALPKFRAINSKLASVEHVLLVDLVKINFPQSMDADVRRAAQKLMNMEAAYEGLSRVPTIAALASAQNQLDSSAASGSPAIGKVLHDLRVPRFGLPLHCTS